MMSLMKKRPKKTDKFSLTEVGTLIEAMRAEFKPILEDIPSIKAKLDSTFEQVGKNTEGIELLRFLVTKNAEEIRRIRDIVTKNAEEIRRIRDIVTKTPEEIELIRQKLKSKVDRKDFELFEKKVASLTG